MKRVIKQSNYRKSFDEHYSKGNEWNWFKLEKINIACLCADGADLKDMEKLYPKKKKRKLHERDS